MTRNWYCPHGTERENCGLMCLPNSCMHPADKPVTPAAAVTMGVDLASGPDMTATWVYDGGACRPATWEDLKGRWLSVISSIANTAAATEEIRQAEEDMFMFGAGFVRITREGVERLAPWDVQVAVDKGQGDAFAPTQEEQDVFSTLPFIPAEEGETLCRVRVKLPDAGWRSVKGDGITDHAPAINAAAKDEIRRSAMAHVTQETIRLMADALGILPPPLHLHDDGTITLDEDWRKQVLALTKTAAPTTTAEKPAIPARALRSGV